MSVPLKVFLHETSDFYFEEIHTSSGVEFHIGTETWAEMTTQWLLPKARQNDGRAEPVEDASPVLAQGELLADDQWF